jgi:flagellar biosynthesis/type III secretory pathway chaperone
MTTFEEFSMKISNDALIATIQGAVAEQKSATLAFDPSRLAAANSRLSEALGHAQEAIQRNSFEGVSARPEFVTKLRNVQDSLGINAELIHQASAANGRALASLPIETGKAYVYGADGATSQTQRSRPLGEA